MMRSLLSLLMSISLAASCLSVRGDERTERLVEVYSQVIERDAEEIEAWQQRGTALFKLDRIEESLRDFDHVLELDPDRAPYHWQRGISLYYAGRFDEGRKQFKSHQKVNPDDVENAVWHYMCMARATTVEEARTSMLSVGQDRRVPMSQIYSLFAGEIKPADVEAAVQSVRGAQQVDARFYATLYIGLYFEIHGDPAKAREYIHRAAVMDGDHYMMDVARVHARRYSGGEETLARPVSKGLKVRARGPFAGRPMSAASMQRLLAWRKGDLLLNGDLNVTFSLDIAEVLEGSLGADFPGRPAGMRRIHVIALGDLGPAIDAARLQRNNVALGEWSLSRLPDGRFFVADLSKTPLRAGPDAGDRVRNLWGGMNSDSPERRVAALAEAGKSRNFSLMTALLEHVDDGNPVPSSWQAGASSVSESGPMTFGVVARNSIHKLSALIGVAGLPTSADRAGYENWWNRMLALEPFPEPNVLPGVETDLGGIALTDKAMQLAVAGHNGTAFLAVAGLQEPLAGIRTGLVYHKMDGSGFQRLHDLEEGTPVVQLRASHSGKQSAAVWRSATGEWQSVLEEGGKIIKLGGGSDALHGVDIQRLESAWVVACLNSDGILSLKKTAVDRTTPSQLVRVRAARRLDLRRKLPLGMSMTSTLAGPVIAYHSGRRIGLVGLSRDGSRIEWHEPDLHEAEGGISDLEVVSDGRVLLLAWAEAVSSGGLNRVRIQLRTADGRILRDTSTLAEYVTKLTRPTSGPGWFMCVWEGEGASPHELRAALVTRSGRLVEASCIQASSLPTSPFVAAAGSDFVTVLYTDTGVYPSRIRMKKIKSLDLINPPEGRP